MRTSDTLLIYRDRKRESSEKLKPSENGLNCYFLTPFLLRYGDERGGGNSIPGQGVLSVCWKGMGRAVQTGIIAATKTPGFAVDVWAGNDLIVTAENPTAKCECATG